jgi:cytosol alanyl aminopeptidase
MKMLRALSLILLVATTPLFAAEPVRLGNDVVPISEAISVTTDPRSDDFSGSVAIELQVKKATPTFRFHAEDMTLTSLKLTKGSKAVGVTHAKGEDATVLVTAAAPLQPGRYNLAIDFTSKYNRQAVGLYKMTVKETPYLFTQFQAIDARKAFPAWDEPGFKIPYELTLTIPEQYEAVSNTSPVSESKKDGLKTIRFAKTKPLPSYLIAMAVGEFESTTIQGMSVPGRIIAPKGQGHLTKYAAEVTPAILASLEKYFGSKHPFEKVDVLGVPEYWAGAMENPGAITFRDTILLLDPATATPTQRQNMIRIMAHELAHMWFGDLVTMEWWDDFWLNESFADWMGDKTADQLYPEYGHALAELAGIQQVMSTDARSTTDPIRKKDVHPDEAMRNVGIAYDKGKAVLSMFEQWIGPEKFRQGVLEHIKSNSWGNANAAEFFASLAKHSPAGTVAALETFINQPGLPLVTVELIAPNQVRLSQTRFTTGQAAAQTWRIPVTLRYSDGNTTRTTAVLLDAPSKTITLQGDRIDWLFPHANAAGYYRWKMPEASMASMASKAVDTLTPAERYAFIGNLGALFRNGTIHGDAYLDIIGGFATDPDPQVLSTLLGALGNVRTTFDSDENRTRFAAYLRRTIGPALDRIGLTPKAGEPERVTTLRPQLLTLLGTYGEDERVNAFMREQLPKLLENPNSVHPTLAGLVITTNARNGDAALFEEYRKRFESATLPAERARFLTGMGSFRDPAIRKKAREYSFTSNVRPTELFNLWGVADNSQERDELFTWLTANYETIMKRLPPAFAANMPFIASGCEPERVTRAREFFKANKIEGVERSLLRVEEQVNECAAMKAREMAAVSAYLSAQGK